MANFLTLSTTTGSYDGGFTLTPSTNPFRSSRSQTVTVNPNGRKAIITQKGLGGSTDSLYLSFDATTNIQEYTGSSTQGASVSSTVYSSNDGAAVKPTVGTPSKTWLTVTIGTAVNDAYPVTFNIASDAVTSDETATVTFTQGSSVVTATITKKGADAFLYIGKTPEEADAKNVDDLTYSINADDTADLTVYVSSNTSSWTVA